MATPVVVSRIQNRRGLQDQFNGSSAIYPPGYDGTGGYGSIPGYDAISFPNVLLPGEIAFCTDTRRIFLGNINGEYIEIAQTSTDAIDLELLPITVQLPPVTTFTPINALNYMPLSGTPFITIFYDVTDEIVSDDWNAPGTNFSRNGTLQVTSIKPAGTPPTATLTDSGTEINNLPANSISFIAEYNGTGPTAFIQIKYKHNFPGNLTLNSKPLEWQSFV